MCGSKLMFLILLSIFIHLVNSTAINCASDLNSIGVPTRPPRVDTGSYMVHQNVHTMKYGYPTRDIFIYWREINETNKCGISLEYHVYCTPTTIYNTTIDIPVKKTYSNYVKFENLNTNIGYTFSIYSSNEYGLSIRNSTINVPSESNRNPKQLSLTRSILHDKNVFELSWKNDINTQKTKYDYTLFWCEKNAYRPYECNGHINWLHIPGSDSNFYVILKDNKTNNHFAISENTKRLSKKNANKIISISSGMIWESCTVLENKLPDKIENIHINNITSTSIEMYWKLDCFNKRTTVHGYQVMYCPVFSKNNIQCEEPILNKNIDLMTRDVDNTTFTVIYRDITTLFITELRPATTYMFRVSVITCGGEGLPNDPLIVTTRAQANLSASANASVSASASASASANASVSASVSAIASTNAS